MERNLTHIALFAALIAVLGLVPQIDLAVRACRSPRSRWGSCCAARCWGAKRGALAVLLFLALVAAGLPLLSGGRGGLGVFAGPSVGFLVGFPVAAFVTGWLMERDDAVGRRRRHRGSGHRRDRGALCLRDHRACRIMLDKTLPEAAFLGMAFLPGDILKAVLAGLVTQSLARMRPASLLSRA